ncbi:MAG: TetR/AcrR family transcriptional regulator [Thermodesulfobacteriota bacterium]
MTWNKGEYEPKQKRAEEKKARILDAALDLFSEKGFHGTNTKEIAASAGVATGTVYRYFRDKKALFMGVWVRMETSMRQRIFGFGRRLAEESMEPAELLEAFARYAMEAHRAHRGFHREIMALQLLDPDMAEFNRQREQRVLNELRDFLEGLHGIFRTGDLEAAAELVYLAVEETAHRAVIHESGVGEERLVAALTDMLSCYLLPKTP